MATIPKDPMDALAKQLSAFHISARLQKAAEEIQPIPKRYAIGSLEPVTFSPATLPSPNLASSSSRRPGLPSPELGYRPCWEPPILDYSWLEAVLDAEKELNRRDGSRDIAWRTDAMNEFFEYELLHSYYSQWVVDQRTNVYLHDIPFWDSLLNDVRVDYSELAISRRTTQLRHEKQFFAWLELRDAITKIAQTKDASFPDAPVDDMRLREELDEILEEKPSPSPYLTVLGNEFALVCSLITALRKLLVSETITTSYDKLDMPLLDKRLSETNDLALPTHRTDKLPQPPSPSAPRLMSRVHA